MELRLALLRGINVGGRRLKMADLRALCAALGWEEVDTFIQSGNLLFRAAGAAAALEEALEARIRSAFAMEVPVIVRSRAQVDLCLAANPLVREAREAPNRLMLLFAKRKLAAGAAAAVEARGQAGERAVAAGGCLWLWFPQGSGRSKLTPSLLDRLVGSPATTRNHRTMTKLAAMLAAKS